MSRTLTITVLMDEACVDPDGYRKPDPDSAAEYHVVNSLRVLGHEVRILGVGDSLESIVAELTDHRPDLVFNLTEQYRDQRSLDKDIAGVLELLDLPFTGSGSDGLMLCRNKALCKLVMAAGGIAVPGFVVVPPGRQFTPSRKQNYPVVVKPLSEDGSDGISNMSLVKSPQEFVERARMVHEHFRQAAIAEDYIEGRELYVSVLGNSRLTVLPPRELRFGGTGSGAPVLATYRVKWNEEYRKKWKLEFGFADLDRDLLERIGRLCRRAYRLLQIRDYGRIDLRLTPDNRVVVLETNPNPNLDKEDELAESAARAGMPYVRLIDSIVRMARARGARNISAGAERTELAAAGRGAAP